VLASVSRRLQLDASFDADASTVSHRGIDVTSDAGGELGKGSAVGRYELLAPLGSGGMAEVWRARPRRPGTKGVVRDVAIKIARRACALDLESRRMFHAEAAIGAAIHHANVVDVLELGETRGRPFLVMSLVDGPTLSRLLASGPPVPVEIAVAVIGDVLRGLHAAHEARQTNGASFDLVHGDVSPQNVLVGADGLARICDFGVARLGLTRPPRTECLLAGKVSYFAPEQAMGEPLDRRVDVFAAGVILWELLAAAPLFRSSSRDRTLENVLVAPITHPSDVRSVAPRALGDVAMRALSREPSERFATSRAFGQALAAAARAVGLAPSIDDVAAFVEARAANAPPTRT